MDGLLHKVEIPESIKFSKGDELNVCIKSIDLERKRISLSLSLVDSENSKKPQHNEKLAG